MSIPPQKRLLPLYTLAVFLLTGACDVWADPFSATYTTRESKRISAIATAAPFTRTYQALTQDSKDLTFYESTEGKLFIAFASKDGTLDDLGQNSCSTSAYYQVYWADKYQNLPPVCVSKSLYGGNGNGDSDEPLIAGSGDDEGRYVAYETDATNVIFLVPTNTPTQTPTPTPTFTGTPGAVPATPTPVPPTPGRLIGDHQVAFHDRKWGFNIPTCSICDVGSYSYSNGVSTVQAQGCNGSSEDLYLWQMGDSGKDLLLSTSAFNMRDNRTPTCQDGNPTSDVFIRDGSACAAGAPGACKTSVLDDNTGYQIYDPSYETLDQDAQNVQMVPDGSVVVFDTAATNPMHFTPDINGFKDIYRHTKERFTRVTQSMVPFCSTAGKLLPLTNEFGAPNGSSERPTVDSTGRFIAFESDATDLVVWEGNPAMKCSTPGAPHPDDIQYISTSGFRQIYVYDHLNKKIEMISSKYRSSSATRMQGGNGNSTNARISRDGRFVIFESAATDLMKTVTSSFRNIFMYDRYLKQTYLVTTGTGGAGLDQNADLTHISFTGLSVAFQTKATNVVVEGPLQGTSTGGTVALCSGNAQTCWQHIYIARHSCPLDTDGDLVPDCSGLDSCPNDQNKTEPKTCGCGVPETDTDSDLTPDCVDTCKEDPKKTSPGGCGCGKPDTDSDLDGTADCVDTCPYDNSKASPGTCGCGVSDVDTDQDGSPDCNDSCPTDPAKSGKTGCACGSLKDVPGVCGCNIADNDDNGNGQPDCLDPSTATQPTAAAYVTTKLNLGKEKTFNILRIKMQNFGGKVTYSYSLTKGKYKLTKTSKTSTISVNGLKSGTYTFSYLVSTGTGSKKVSTKVTTSTIKIP